MAIRFRWNTGYSPGNGDAHFNRVMHIAPFLFGH
jgi:hypothetical protein